MSPTKFVHSMVLGYKKEFWTHYPLPLPLPALEIILPLKTFGWKSFSTQLKKP